MKKSILLISLLFAFRALNAQQVSAIYKTGDLLKRISSTDTLYVVNFWATWCKPCIEELPVFDSLLAGLKRDEKVKILLVNLNFSDEVDKKVNPFLKQKAIKATCVLLNEVNGNVYIDKISPAWSGAIPATYIKKGDRSELIEKKLTLNQLSQVTDKYKKS